MSNGAERQGESGRLPVVNYTVGLAWPAPPQTHLYNFLEGSNSSVKRDPEGGDGFLRHEKEKGRQRGRQGGRS